MTIQFSEACRISRCINEEKLNGAKHMRRGRKPTEKTVEFKTGDVVRLKSGSPYMTVMSKDPNDPDVRCSYFMYCSREDNNNFQTMYFNPLCLELAPTSNSLGLMEMADKEAAINIRRRGKR